jgi:steroid delta-isomerase-like uncharacterized protein
MTTEANKILVREFVDAVNQQDWQHFDELVAPDFNRHSSTFGQSRVRSRESLRAYLIDEFKTFKDARESINFMVAEGDKVAVHSHFHGVQEGPLGSFPPTGKILSADFVTIYRIADGRIVEAWTEWDALSGLIQLGHLQPPTQPPP